MLGVFCNFLICQSALVYKKITIYYNNTEDKIERELLCIPSFSVSINI
uniref:Uncharacterized protein n=1 Tax=Rhizophora mucronata TaxID=61149 RepID=A0A2P2N733_RHIMU